jgi:hypothetical protein
MRWLCRAKTRRCHCWQARPWWWRGTPRWELAWGEVGLAANLWRAPMMALVQGRSLEVSAEIFLGLVPLLHLQGAETINYKLG